MSTFSAFLPQARWVVSSLGLTLSLILPASVSAATACDDIAALVETEMVSDISDLAVKVTGTALPEPVCGRSLALSGKSSLYCSWPFDYRSSVATKVFDGMLEQMSKCFGHEVSPNGDARVNHPDSYDLRVFEVGPGRINLSIKDKGGLNKTLVFLRVEQGSAP